MTSDHSIVMTKKTKSIQDKQDEFNTQVLKVLADLNKKIDKSPEPSKTLEAKSDEWVTLVESAKGKKISLAPENPKYDSRMVAINRFSKSIGVPANQFEEFVGDCEVVLNKLREGKLIPS